THTATRLNDDPGTCLDDNIQSIPEREKSIRGDNRASQTESGMVCFDRGDSCTIDSAHLASADAQGLSLGTEYDRVRFNKLCNTPGKETIFNLLWRRLSLANNF